MVRPGKRPRARRSAIRTPKGRLQTVATEATFRLSRIAVHSSGVNASNIVGRALELVGGRDRQ